MERDAAAAAVYNRPHMPPVPSDMPSYMRPTVNSVTRVTTLSLLPIMIKGTFEQLLDLSAP